jgi:hypothetical protein
MATAAATAARSTGTRETECAAVARRARRSRRSCARWGRLVLATTDVVLWQSCGQHSCGSWEEHYALRFWHDHDTRGVARVRVCHRCAGAAAARGAPTSGASGTKRWSCGKLPRAAAPFGAEARTTWGTLGGRPRRWVALARGRHTDTQLTSHHAHERTHMRAHAHGSRTHQHAPAPIRSAGGQPAARSAVQRERSGDSGPPDDRARRRRRRPRCS